MTLRRVTRLGAALLFAAFAAVVPTTRMTPIGHAQPPLPPLSSNASVFATGLIDPRGLRFGPDGNLYVGEAGKGGTRSTLGLTNTAAGTCFPPPQRPGPFLGGYTARISEISPSGARTTFVDSLPSGVAGGIFSLGVSDVEFVNGNLYALLVGAGCDHGNTDVPVSVIRVNPDASWTVVANLSRFERANPVRHPDPNDYDPDGSWYSLTSVNGDIFAVNPNGSEVDKISPTTIQINRIVDMSSEPWIGPTSIAYHNGNFYLGALGEFPIKPGSQNIYTMTPDGTVSTYASGFTDVVSIAFDSKGQLYALESMTNPGLPGPGEVGSGKVVRVTPSGPQTVASGFTFPTAMTFGSDGKLYVSNLGFGFPAGSGQIVRVDVTHPSP